MNEMHPITFETETKLYRCEVGQSVTIWETNFFGLSVPPGDMLALADFILSHRASLEQQQRELDQQHETLVKEVKEYCTIHEKPFSALSSWDITDMMRELAGTTGHCND